MSLVQDFYLTVFVLMYQLIFPLFKNAALSTYVMILILNTLAVYKSFRFIQSKKGQAKGGQTSLKFSAQVVGTVFLAGYWFWFVFIHFKSVKTLS